MTPCRTPWRRTAWLAGVVSSVAYAPRVAVASEGVSDPAPAADMVERMGGPSEVPRVQAGMGAGVPTSVLFVLLIAAPLLEWVSRRTRGAK